MSDFRQLPMSGLPGGTDGSRQRVLVFICLAFAGKATASEDPIGLRSREELLAFIEANRRGLGDIEARFSGSVRDLVPRLRSKPIPPTKSEGIWRYRADGKQLIECTETVGEGPARKMTISSADRIEQFVEGGTARRQENHLWEMAMGGRPGVLFALLTLADFWWPQLQNSAEVERTENIDGHKCLRFTFDARSHPADASEPIGPPRVGRVWLDLERGGQVVRWEFFEPNRGDTPTARMIYQLSSFGDFWIPESYRSESFFGPDAKLLTKPAVVQEVCIDLSTLSINQGLRDDQVEPELSPGTFVEDLTKGKRYFVGDSPPHRPVADAQKQLDDLAATADAEARRFRARYSRTSLWWWAAAIFFLSGAVVGGIGLVLHRARH